MGSMDIDLSRLPTGSAGWCALVDHALGLGDLSEVDWFELKGRLPFGSRTDRKKSAVTIARAILGMANRMPDAADLHLSGHGVVLVGIESGAVSGAENVDGADLHNVLDPYVQQDGLRWDYNFINHSDGLVMAVVVDPPSWGDPIFTFRKEYSADGRSIRDGEVFVRVPGKTRPATSDDQRDLQRRLVSAPSVGADVLVGVAGNFDRVNTLSAVEMIEWFVDDFADSLLADVPRPMTGTFAMPSLVTSVYGRQPDEFVKEVEDWRTEARARVEYVATEFLRHSLARNRLSMTNRSDKFLEDVEVRVHFPAGVQVLIGSETDYCHHGGQFNFFALLPEKPPKWENYSVLGRMDSSFFRSPRIDPVTLPSEFSIEVSDGGTVVTWAVGNLRPRGNLTSDELLAILTDGHGSPMPFRWEATARRVDHVFAGDGRIDCAQEPEMHLNWSARPPSAIDSGSSTD